MNGNYYKPICREVGEESLIWNLQWIIILYMHLQRNAYQNYILLLTNNFKFYILQILGHLNFLSVFFVFAKNQFANLITRRLQPLVLQFREKHQDATARKGLKPLVIKKLIATPHAVCRWQAHCVNISEKSAR